MQNYAKYYAKSGLAPAGALSGRGILTTGRTDLTPHRVLAQPLRAGTWGGSGSQLMAGGSGHARDHSTGSSLDWYEGPTTPSSLIKNPVTSLVPQQKTAPVQGKVVLVPPRQGALFSPVQAPARQEAGIRVSVRRPQAQCALLVSHRDWLGFYHANYGSSPDIVINVCLWQQLRSS